MTGMNWDELSPEERLVAEQAVLNLRELNQAAYAAADGAVLNVCEKLALDQGRQLTRTMLEASMREQGQAVEKKGRRLGRARAE